MNWTQYLEKTPDLVISYGINALAAIVIFFVGKWFAKRLVGLGTRLMTQRGVDATVGGFVSNIAYMFFLMLIIIAALGRLGVPTAQFIAIIGAAGLAIGLALQGSLSNFASGVLLVTFRPCRVGDYIEAGGVSGTVDQITVFSTTLITPDKRTITVPNSQIMGGAITNFSTSPTRRLDLVIGVGYGSDIELVKRLLREVVEADERVLDAHKPIQIGLLELGQSALNFTVRPFVRTEDYLSLKFDLQERIKLALDENHISIPYPHVSVMLENASS